MTNSATILTCIECGAVHAKWTGQCTACAAWNTIVEETVEPPAGRACPHPQLAPTVRLVDVDAGVGRARQTGIGELDRVLGGGLVAGSVTLLGGEPGIGKSTLMLQLLAGWGGPTLYVSAEESPEQVKGRAERLGCSTPDGWIAAETSLRGVVASIEQVGPELVVVDSIQTIADERVSSSPGSTAQVRTCAQQLVVEAKRRGVAVVLVGHVTKDGTVAGPRQLEHAVDTVLSFEGERHHALRLLRAAKHRFGPTSELGLFEMTDGGLEGVPDPSHLFLADRRRGVAGSVIVPAMAGQRPLLVEVQALTVPVPQGAQGRRNANGLDAGRLAMLLAVIERRAGLAVASNDVYVSTVGGARLTEPGTDLGVAMAVIGAVHDAPIGRDLVVLGELGLGGEVRQVAQTPRRLAEAARLGYRRAIVPASAPTVDGIRNVPVDTLADAVIAAHGHSVDSDHAGPPAQHQ
jgi:DNA repair protein RadA/Sms